MLWGKSSFVTENLNIVEESANFFMLGEAND